MKSESWPLTKDSWCAKPRSKPSRAWPRGHLAGLPGRITNINEQTPATLQTHLSGIT